MTPAQHFDVAVSLVGASQAIALPKSFGVEVDLVYPQGYDIDKEELADQLLRNSGTHQVPPFVLLHESEQILSSNDPSLVHKKISYQLEPQFPGKYALTFFEFSFMPEGSKSAGGVQVISPIVYVTVDLLEPPEINLAVEAAPLSNLSERIPIELAKETRSYLSHDQSMHNVALFKAKELPWNFGIGLVFVSLWLAGSLLLYTFLKKNQPLQLPRQRKNALFEAEKLLEVLKTQSVLDRSTVENFAHELRASLQEYFETFYSMTSFTFSTPEFLKKLEAHPQLNQEQKTSIEEIFVLADQIKFGKYSPSLEECMKIFEAVKNLNLLLSVQTKVLR